MQPEVGVWVIAAADSPLEEARWDDPEGRVNYHTGWDRVLERFAAAAQSVNE